jgi:hypothetical protein
VEDLGGGLKAIFTLENGFDVNSGALGQAGRELGVKRTSVSRVMDSGPSRSGAITIRSLTTCLTFRRSRTQFGVNFVASRAGEMRMRPAG